jgi:hypothetical protein
MLVLPTTPNGIDLAIHSDQFLKRYLEDQIQPFNIYHLKDLLTSIFVLTDSAKL